MLSQVQRHWALIVFAIAASCSTPNAAHTGAPTAEVLTAPGPTVDEPSSSDLESKRLADAFGGESASTSGSQSARPSVKGNVPSIHVDEESTGSRAEFDRHLTAANRSLKVGNFEDCEAEIAALERLLGSLGPAYPPRVFELHHRIDAAKKNFKLAQKAAERWLLSCPATTGACRQRALTAWERAVRGPPVVRFAAQRIERIHQSDSCLAQAEAGLKVQGDAKVSADLPCLSSAMAVYRQQGDKLMVARVLLVRARSVEAEPKREAEAARLLDQAQRSCDEPRCAAIRRRSLQRLAVVEARLGNLEAAARAALMEMSLAALELPPDQRPFARTAEVDRICQLLDARNGFGSCRRLEKSLFGTYRFRDFSKEQATHTGLTAEMVREVNEHFGIMIHECLTAEAQRRPTTQETYHLYWTVLNDGRVRQVHFETAERGTGPLADCIRSQFAFWRYPRYRGEWQNIDQTFVVKARETQIAAESPN